MKIIIYSLPQHGHINPTLAITNELSRRGHEVIYYMTEEFQEKIEKAGGIFKPLGTTLNIYDEARKAIDSHKENGNFLPTDAVGVFIQFMADTMSRFKILAKALESENPDLVIYDPMCIWGQILAKGHNFKRVTFYTTYPMVSGDTMSDSMSDLFKNIITPRIIGAIISLFWSLLKVNIKYRMILFSPLKLFTAKESLNLVPLPKGFLPNASELDESYLFFGPNLMLSYSHKSEPLPESKGKRYLYVSMGSTALNNQPELFRAVIDGFRKSAWHVVMNIGEAKRESLGKIPENVILRNYVPQIEILQKADVFITHGGMNSVMESCYFGVPMIVLALQPETKITAHQIAALGIGISIVPTDLLGYKLHDMANSIYDTASYEEKIRIIQNELKVLGGSNQACDSIEAYFMKS